MGETSAADFHRGRRIGKYEILTRLSIGGMAELFLAYLPGPGGFKKFVALKQILGDVKADESFVKMFLDEARITAGFTHANIGQVFDLGEDPESGELYLAMEFIAGQNLDQVMRRASKRERSIPVGFSARVIRDVSLGLHYAHTYKDPLGQPMPVVHRDANPKNVMITYSGQVKVIDFGIAKARGRLNRTQVGIVKGTSGYMSPEQLRNGDVDGRTDLFAAGVMLHELLCAERLFTAPTDAAMMLKIVEAQAQDPSSVNRLVTPEFGQVVLKVLEKKRDLRFASGKEFARAIEQSCPDLYDDEQLAEFMSALFDDRIVSTRALLERANEGDVENMSLALARLSSDDDLRRKTGNSPRHTPSPRPATPSSQRVPQVNVSHRGLKPVPSAPPPPRKSSKPSLPAVDPQSSTIDPDATLPPNGRIMASSAVSHEEPPTLELPANPQSTLGDDVEEVTTGPRPAPQAEPRTTAESQPDGQGDSRTDIAPIGESAEPDVDDRGPPLVPLMAVVGVLVVLAVVGSMVAFGPLREPVRAWFKPSAASLAPATPRVSANAGFLTLRTTNPAASLVFDQGASLGSTPLVKVPCEPGVHRLRLIDREGQGRELVVKVDRGQSVELPPVDVGDLPLAP